MMRHSSMRDIFTLGGSCLFSQSVSIRMSQYACLTYLSLVVFHMFACLFVSCSSDRCESRDRFHIQTTSFYGYVTIVTICCLLFTSFDIICQVSSVFNDLL